MTRRDRAAMVLAYEWCRSSVAIPDPLYRADQALRFGGPMARSIFENIRHTTTRLTRARLALLLRAMLRAPQDAYETVCGECGTAYCREFYEDEPGAKFMHAWFEHQDCNCDGMTGDDPFSRPLRYRALWESAPPHTERTR